MPKMPKDEKEIHLAKAKIEDKPKVENKKSDKNEKKSKAGKVHDKAANPVKTENEQKICETKSQEPKYQPQKIIFKPPVKVSPLIRLFRYTFLLCGIIYGFSKQCRYAIKEGNLREIRKEQQILRDAKLAEEKRLVEEEMYKAIDDVLSADKVPKPDISTPPPNDKKS